jgi:hypothetical protein
MSRLKFRQYPRSAADKPDAMLWYTSTAEALGGNGQKEGHTLVSPGLPLFCTWQVLGFRKVFNDVRLISSQAKINQIQVKTLLHS